MNGLAESILGGIDNIGEDFVRTVYMQLGNAMGNVFFLSLTTFLMIQQILIYGFLGFYFSLVNAALNTATSGGATMDSKMSLVLPLVLVTIIGIYVLMQIPSIASILNGGG